MIKTVEVCPDIYSKSLAEFLSERANDFVEMEWRGNPYTGEGSDYPVIYNIDYLAKLICEHLNK